MEMAGAIPVVSFRQRLKDIDKLLRRGYNVEWNNEFIFYWRC